MDIAPMSLNCREGATGATVWPPLRRSPSAVQPFVKSAILTNRLRRTAGTSAAHQQENNKPPAIKEGHRRSRPKQMARKDA